MVSSTIHNNSIDPMYQDLLDEYPGTPPEAIEAALQFMKIAANLHIRQESLFSQFGLTTGRFSLLMMLRHEPKKELPPSELAKRAHVSRATMTQFVDGLEKEQLIVRADDPNDRRTVLVRLTPKAEKLLKNVLPSHLERLVEFTSVLSRKERKELFLLMEKLIRE